MIDFVPEERHRRGADPEPNRAFEVAPDRPDARAEASLVRAAGVVVYRRAPAQATGIEVLLLRHAPRRGRGGWWTPPKGHLDEGEDDRTAALRETEEECGIERARLAVDPGFRREVQYEAREAGRRRRKVVVYFLAEAPSDAEVRLSHEHDAALWLAPDEAIERIPYPNLRAIIEDAAAYLASRDDLALSPRAAPEPRPAADASTLAALPHEPVAGPS